MGIRIVEDAPPHTGLHRAHPQIAFFFMFTVWKRVGVARPCSGYGQVPRMKRERCTPDPQRVREKIPALRPTPLPD